MRNGGGQVAHPRQALFRGFNFEPVEDTAAGACLREEGHRYITPDRMTETAPQARKRRSRGVTVISAPRSIPEPRFLRLSLNSKHRAARRASETWSHLKLGGLKQRRGIDHLEQRRGLIGLAVDDHLGWGEILMLVSQVGGGRMRVSSASTSMSALGLAAEIVEKLHAASVGGDLFIDLPGAVGARQHLAAIWAWRERSKRRFSKAGGQATSAPTNRRDRHARRAHVDPLQGRTGLTHGRGQQIQGQAEAGTRRRKRRRIGHGRLRAQRDSERDGLRFGTRFSVPTRPARRRGRSRCRSLADRTGRAGLSP